MNTLTKEDRLLRDVHIEVVRQGINTTEEVARSLVVLRDRNLYRETHSTFEAFCRDTFAIGKSRAYQLIEFVETKDEISTFVDSKNMNEAQARELGKLETPAERAEVWSEVIEETDGKPTAKAVKEAVEKRKIDTAETSRPQQSTSFDDDTCDLEDFIQRLQDCIDEEFEAGLLDKSQIVDGVYKAAIYAKGLK